MHFLLFLEVSGFVMLLFLEVSNFVLLLHLSLLLEVIDFTNQDLLLHL